MGLGKFFNKIKSGGAKFFSKTGEGAKILSKVSQGLGTVGHLAEQAVSSPIVQAGANALGAYVGDPNLGKQMSQGAKFIGNLAHQGSQLTNQANYAGNDLNQIKNNVLERAQNIQKTVNAGPQFA